MVEVTNQLRFNVHVAPDPAKMATSFKLRPGPVIIEQLPTRGRHVESLPERMEIASKLARRQLEHIMLRWATTRDTVTTQPPGKQQHSSLTGSSLRHTRPPSPPPSSSVLAATRHPPPAPSHRVRTTKPPPTSSPPPLRSNVRMKPAHHVEPAPPHRVRMYRSPAELIRLREDLAQQVKRLLQLLRTDNSNASGRPPQHVTVQFFGSENQGRLMFEEEEERVKEARKAEGQLVRNNRILYQLKQTVTTAEREYSKYAARSHGSVQSNKYGAVSSLATGLRTAVRTLQTITCNGVSLLNSRVCCELADMLEQLSTLASHLLEDNGTREHNELSLDEVLHQLRQYLEIRKESEEHRPPSLPPPPARPVARPSRGRGKRRRPAPGVLIVRQTKCTRQKWLQHRPVGSPGYTKATFASTIRQSPRRPYFHSSINRCSSPTLAKTASPRQIKNISPVPHITDPVPHSTSPVQHSTSPVQRSASPMLSQPLEEASKKEAIAENGEKARHHPHDLAERELMRQAWLDTRVTEQVHDLQEMRKRGEHELKELQGLLQRPRQLVEEAEETIRDKLNPLLERAEVLKASHITGPQHPPPNKNTSEGLQRELPGKGEGLQRVDLELMLQKLEEFEREEGRVRERWRSIVYEDQALPGAVREVSQCRQFHPVLPRGVASAVDSYTDRYARYRQQSEQKIGLDTNMLVKCLTEEILDEIVSEVADEVDTILAGCVDNMFDQEFYQPSSC